MDGGKRRGGNKKSRSVAEKETARVSARAVPEVEGDALTRCA
jgi:hypothetical protein